MKKLFLVILPLFFINCHEKENQPLSISGKASNYDKDYVLLGRDTTGLGLNSVIDSVELDQDGKFHHVFQKEMTYNSLIVFVLPKPFQLSLSKFIVDPVAFTLDVSKVDSLSISGKQAPFFNYSQDQNKYWAEMYQNLADRHQVLAQRDNQKEEYHKIQDTITQLRINFLEDYFKGSEIKNQPQFIAFERNSLIYSNLYYRMSGQEKEIIKKLSFYQNSASDDLPSLNYSDQVDFSNESLFQIPYYREFLFEFLRKDISLNSPEDSPSSYEYFLINGLGRINVWFETPETNSLAKVIWINDLLTNAKIFKAQIDVEEFSRTINELEEDPIANKYLPILNEALADFKNPIITAGSKAPNFKLVNKNDQVFTLSSTSGKMIFIDVWASWCGPCISAFPKWNDFVLRNQNNKNIEFLTISVDETEVSWKNGLGKYSLKGTNLYAGKGGFKSAFAQDYDVKALPHYIAIDENGRILTMTTSFADLLKIPLH